MAVQVIATSDRPIDYGDQLIDCQKRQALA